MAETEKIPEMLLVIKSYSGDFSFNRGKDEVIRMDSCPAGFTCIKDGISILKKELDPEGDDGTIYTYKIEMVPNRWESDSEWIKISLPKKYLVERVNNYRLSYSEEESIVIPVKIKRAVSGGSIFFYGGMIGVNPGATQAKKFAGIYWEIVGDWKINFITPPSKFFLFQGNKDKDFSLMIPHAPFEFEAPLSKIGYPPNFDEVLKKKFNALRELLAEVKGDKKKFEKGKEKIEAEFEIWSREYEKKKEEYAKLLKEAEAEKSRRIEEWKKSFMNIKNLASFIEAEVKRRYEEDGIDKIGI